MPETICLTKYTLETDLLVGLFCFRSICVQQFIPYLR